MKKLLTKFVIKLPWMCGGVILRLISSIVCALLVISAMKFIEFLFFPARYFNKALSRVSFDIGSKLNSFLATGNLVSPTGLDLQQAAGFTIVAERLNWYRYISHFRCIHRGAFFAELKTTTVRKLLPEAWGMYHFFTAGFIDAYLSYVLRFPLPRAYP